MVYENTATGTNSAVCGAATVCGVTNLMVKRQNAQGFALLDLVFVCGLIGILASIATPRMLQAKQTAGAASAIGSLRAINSAQLSYAFTCASGFYAPDLVTLGTPPSVGSDAFISPNLSSAMSVTRAGYIIQLEGTPFAPAPATCNGLLNGQAAQGFRAAADPVEADNFRFLATNANMTIVEDSASLWAGMPESGEPVAGHPIQ